MQALEIYFIVINQIANMQAYEHSIISETENIAILINDNHNQELKVLAAYVKPLAFACL